MNNPSLKQFVEYPISKGYSDRIMINVTANNRLLYSVYTRQVVYFDTPLVIESETYLGILQHFFKIKKIQKIERPDYKDSMIAVKKLYKE
jgi:hypothetical protein